MASGATGTPRVSGWSPDRSILRACIADANDLSTMCRADICPGFAARPVRLPPASGRSTPMPLTRATGACRPPASIRQMTSPPRRIGTQPNATKEHAMPERIYTSSGDGKLDALDGMAFPKEDELQALIAEHPELLDVNKSVPETRGAGSSLPARRALFRRPAGCHTRRPLRLPSSRMLRRAMGLEDNDAKIGERSQPPLDAWSDLVPCETTETGTERWYGYRFQIETTDFLSECDEPGVDVLQTRGSPPVTLGREVDDVAWWRKLVRLVCEHPSGLDFTVAVRRSVGPIILRSRLPELLGSPRAHVPNTVDRVDKGIGLFCQQISGLVLDHRRSPMVSCA